MLQITFVKVFDFALVYASFTLFFTFCYIAMDGYTMAPKRGLGMVGTQFFSQWRSYIGYIDIPMIHGYQVLKKKSIEQFKQTYEEWSPKYV